MSKTDERCMLLAGSDQCRFCEALADCRKRAEYNLTLDEFRSRPSSGLNEEEMASILSQVDEMIVWGGDIKEFALENALNGTKYPGFKVVAGRSATRFTDEEAVAEAVRAAGEEPYEQKLLGITALKQKLGKKKFQEILGGLTCKPPGKPRLVPVMDKRPAIKIVPNETKEEKKNA